MATKRIYLVATPDGTIRLVNASLRQQALSHVANSMFTVRVASQRDLVDSLQKGVQVENYRDPDQGDFLKEGV
jgi:hypothetical protein